MKSFLEWLTEVSANDDSLLGYVARIESEPNADDVATLVSMMRQTRDQRMSAAIPEIFARLKRVVPRLPPGERETVAGELEEAEEEIYARSREPAGYEPKGSEYDTGSGWRERDIWAQALSTVLGGKNHETNWTQEVIEYMKTHFGFDLNRLGDDDDPVVNQAYEMILDQHATGVLDTRSTAERVAEFLKKNGMV